MDPENMRVANNTLTPPKIPEILSPQTDFIYEIVVWKFFFIQKSWAKLTVLLANLSTA